jgi:cobalt/nickel transport system ATP-binding protein
VSGPDLRTDAPGAMPPTGPAPAAPQPPAFELHGIGYVYGGRQVALDGIDLVIERGERVVLLGANGSGKSTLLKLLDGIVAPTSGHMRALGRDVRAVADGMDAYRFHREVGLVFQDPDVQLFSATVFDDVAFGPLQLGLPKEVVRSVVEDALRQMEITHLANRAPFELSGGEKKRAAIASVLSLQPEVLLLDEPTAALDPRTKWVLVNLIRRLGEGGKTLVTATHELDIVPIIATRVVVLGENRRVLADGPTEAILEDRALLIRANLIHEHLHEHGGVRHAHSHDLDHHDDDGHAADHGPDGADHGTDGADAADHGHPHAAPDTDHAPSDAPAPGA